LRYNPYKSKRRKKKIKQKQISSYRWKTKSKEPSILSDNIIKDKPTYLEHYESKSRKVWLIPLLIALCVIALVLWLGPRFLGTLSHVFPGSEDNKEVITLLYDKNDYAVINERFIDIFESADLRSTRKSQALYNDPVKILDTDHTGFLHIEMSDGTTGYVFTDSVTFETSSVEPFIHSHKLTAVSETVRIMSHASSGSLIHEVVMGTVLYADYGGNGLYRVSLVGGGYGWIGSEGVIRTDPDEEPKMSSANKFYETALKFANATYIPNGITIYGTSSSGIAYICAKVNGVFIPRGMAAQMNAGKKVSKELDPEEYLPGDLIFFEGEKMGIVTGHGQVLMSVRTGNSVKIITLSDHPDLLSSIIEVRRIFPDTGE
jgi:gamma-D-glutamyl-L-lysine dipeptidyl-peptidase